MRAQYVYVIDQYFDKLITTTGQCLKLPKQTNANANMSHNIIMKESIQSDNSINKQLNLLIYNQYFFEMDIQKRFIIQKNKKIEKQKVKKTLKQSSQQKNSEGKQKNLKKTENQSQKIINGLGNLNKNPKQSGNFLDQVFKELKVQRLNFNYPNIKLGLQFENYKTIHIQKLYEKKRLGKSLKVIGKDLWHKDLVKKIYCYEESCPLTEKSENGFFNAFYEAYINHGDIKIAPDDVWMTIMLFFSKYIDSHAEELRSAFVTHQGKKQLSVQTELDQYKWDQFFDKIIVQIKKNTVEKVTQNLQSNFSTTNRFFNFFSTAIIMNSYKKYFDYTRLRGGCGIQNIHMGGSEQDWQKLISKLCYLQQFDVDGQLKFYVSRLKPILEQFLETYRGKASLKFWNNIYHERKNPYAEAYQPSLFINGWLIRFFTIKQILVDESATIEEIDVPIKVVNMETGDIQQMNLVGGCRGISIQKNAYRPHFSFAIVEKDLQKKRVRFF